MKHAINKNSDRGITIERRLGEAIDIGDDIRITLIALGSSKIKILIQAPKDTFIRRERKEDTEIIKFKNKHKLNLYKNKEFNDDERDI